MTENEENIMLMHRRVIAVRKGQTDPFLKLIAGWFEQSNPYSATRIYIAYPDAKEDNSSNFDRVVIEHESEDMPAFEEARNQWHQVVTKDQQAWEDDIKIWSELVDTSIGHQGTIIENWLLSTVYEKSG
jgi:hypothetical protein